MSLYSVRMRCRAHALVLLWLSCATLARRRITGTLNDDTLSNLASVLLVRSPGSSWKLNRFSASGIQANTNKFSSALGSRRPDISMDEEAERKRLRAQRLALEAERAALEAEKLELELSQIRAETKVEQEQVEKSSPETFPSSVTSPVVPVNEIPQPAVGVQTKQQNQLDFTPTQTAFRLGHMLKGKKEDEFQLDEAEIGAAKQSLFDAATFSVREVSQTPIGTIFRGDLRANASVAIERVTSKAAQSLGLKEIQFVLLPDPYRKISEGNSQPDNVFLALKKSSCVKNQDFPELALALATFLFNAGFLVVTALAPILLSAGGDFDRFLENGFEPFIALIIGIGGLQLIHEVAHFIAAKVNGISVGAPIFFPNPWLGTITKLKTFPKDRTALFDFALAGPAVAGAFSLAFFVIGLLASGDIPPVDSAVVEANIKQLLETATSFSDVASTATTGAASPSVVAAATSAVDPNAASTVADSIAGVATGVGDPIAGSTGANSIAAAAASSDSAGPLVATIPRSLFRASFLLWNIARLFLPPGVTDAPYISVNPLALVGFFGIYVNALQLFPLGRTDGGRIQQAALGRDKQITQSLIVQVAVLGALIFGAPFPSYFVQFITLHLLPFQGRVDYPCVDDVTEVDSKRQLITQAVGLLVFLILIPGAIVADGTEIADAFSF